MKEPDHSLQCALEALLREAESLREYRRLLIDWDAEDEYLRETLRLSEIDIDSDNGGFLFRELREHMRMIFKEVGGQ